MSWFGGLNDSFSQITERAGKLGGQLSTFTKEVLAEDGTELPQASSDEAGTLQLQHASTEALIRENHSLKHEVTRLKSIIHKLEIDANNSGVEYEARQQIKQKEINQLKDQLGQYGGGKPTSTLPTHAGDMHLDEYSDVLSAQREINRLSEELHQSKDENQKLKKLAEEIKLQRNLYQSNDHTKRIEELESELKREIQHHVQEVQSLQDAHNATSTKQTEEIRKLKQQINSSNGDASVHTESHDHNEEFEHLKTENNELKDKLRTKNRQLLLQKKKLEAITSNTEKLKHENEEVKKVKEESQQHAMQLIEILALFANSSHLSPQEAVEVIKSNISNLISEKNRLTAQQANHIDEIRRLNQQLDETNHPRAEENNDEIELAESDQHAHEFNSTAEEDRNQDGNLEAESDQYHQHMHIGVPINQSSPRRRVAHHNSTMDQPGDLTLTLQALRKQVEDYEVEIAQFDSIQTEWLQEKISLQSLLDRYQAEMNNAQQQEPYSSDDPEDERAASVALLKQEIDELQEMRSSLENDKTKLVEEKEQFQTAAKNLEEELNMSVADNQVTRDEVNVIKKTLLEVESEKSALQKALDVLNDKMNQSIIDKEETDKALEELDTQHQQEINQMLKIRDDFAHEVKQLQKKLDEEMENKNHILQGIEELKQHLAQKMNETDENNRILQDETEQVKLELQDAQMRNEELQKMISTSEFEMMNNSAHETEELKKQIKFVELELNESSQRESKLEDDLQRLREEIEENLKENEQLIQEIKITEEKCATQEEQIRELKTTPTEKSMRKMEEMKAMHQREVEDLRVDYENMLKEKLTNAQNLEVRFGALEREKKKMNEQLQESVGRCEELEVMNQSLNAQMQALETRKVEAEVQQSISVHEEKQQLHSEIERLEIELEEMGTEMENSGKEMAQIQNFHQAEMEKLKTDYFHEVQTLKEEHQNQIEKLGQEMVDSKSMFECEKRLLTQSHQEEIEKLNLRHDEDVKTKSSSDVQNEKDNEEIHDDYKMKVESLENENEMLEKEIVSCRDEIKNLQEEQQNATDEHKTNLEIVETQYLNEVQKLQMLLDNEAVKMREREEYFDKSMRESAEKHAQEVDSLQMKLHETLDVKKSEVTDLKNRLSSVEDQTKDLLLATEQEYSKEMHLLKEKLAQSENKISEISNHLEDMKTQYNEVHQKLVESEENSIKLNADKSELESNFDNFKNEIEQTHKAVVQRMQETYDHVYAANRRLIDQNNILNEAKVMQENLLKSEQTEHEKMQTLQKCIDEKDETIPTLKAEYKKKEADWIKRIQEETMRLEEDIQTLGEELENSGKQIVEIESKHKNEMNLLINKHKSSDKEFVDKYISTVIELDNKNKDLLQMQKAIEDNLHEFNEAKECLELKVVELQEKLNFQLNKNAEGANVKDGFEKQIHELESERGVLNQQLNDLKQQFDAQVQDISLKNEEIVKEGEQHATEVAALHDTIQQINEETHKLQLTHNNELDTLQRDFKRVSAQNENSEALSNQLQSELDNLQLKLNTVDLEFVTCQEKLKQLETVHQNCNSIQNDDDVMSLRDELKHCKLQYEEKLTKLTSELKNIKMNDAGKKELEREKVDKMLEEIRRRDISGLEKADLSKEHIGSLLSLIKERDEVINLLYQQQSRGKSDDVSVVKKLENEKKNLTIEKEQILTVVTEKTRENRKLKDEVHKMMDVIGAGKTALAKVQQENKDLSSRFEGYDPEMTKDAVTKLSQLVHERELEVESLQQKCNTLLEVLQQTPQQGATSTSQTMDSMVSGQQVQALLKEKEDLSEQVKQLTVERDHLVALVNQKQVEIDELRMTAQAAANDMEHDADNNSKLQIDFGNLVHDYEQTQMKLASVQKELIKFKETANHLEETKELLFSKLKTFEHNITPVVNDNLQKQSNIFNEEDFSILQEKLEKKSESLHQKDILLKDVSEKLHEKDLEMERLSNDLREKDLLIHNQLTEIQRLTKELNVRSNEVAILRKSVENLREQIAAQTKTAEDCRQESKTLASKLEEKQSEAQAFQETNSQISMMLKEKDYGLEMLRDKTARLESAANQHREGQESHTTKLSADLDLAQQQLIAVQHERDQLMVNLKQNHLESSKYSEEAKELREKGHRLESELARLRNHLIQVEESNTQEVLLYAEREESLKQQLSQAISSHSAAHEATEHSIQQIESLQEQLRVAQQQRDNANAQCQLSQEHSAQYSDALQTVQVAVEQMQREEAATHQSQREKQLAVIREKEKEVDDLKQQLQQLKNQLAQTAEILESASRLNEQLELKEKSIDHLKTIVSEKQLQVEELLDKLHDYTQKHESMVDKEIMKNLFIGYFSTSKQNDVIKLITSVLDFTEDEIKQVQPGGWISGWIPSWRGGENKNSRSVPASPRPNNSTSVSQSFSSMFVQFLETESTPHALAKLPAATMVSEAQQRMSQRKFAGTIISSVPTPVHDRSPRVTGTIAGRYNPFTSSTSTPDKKSSSAMLSGTTHPLIMQPLTPILPTFGGQHMGKEILQDVLKSNAAKVNYSH